jgi:hypothetical protein
MVRRGKKVRNRRPIQPTLTFDGTTTDGTTTDGTRIRPGYSAPLLIAIALLAYGNSFRGGFTPDCNQLLLQDPRVRQFTVQNLRDILHHSYSWPYREAGLYRPLPTLSYLFNHTLAGNGTDPFGYHAINFLLHDATCCWLTRSACGSGPLGRPARLRSRRFGPSIRC